MAATNNKTDGKSDSTTNTSTSPKFHIGGFHSQLAAIVGGFKAGVSRFAKQNDIPFAWQSGFHDHIIRNQPSFENIMRYVTENIARWDNDCFNPENHQK